jgi:hypothetical protein
MTSSRINTELMRSLHGNEINSKVTMTYQILTRLKETLLNIRKRRYKKIYALSL